MAENAAYPTADHISDTHPADLSDPVAPAEEGTDDAASEGEETEVSGAGEGMTAEQAEPVAGAPVAEPGEPII